PWAAALVANIYRHRRVRPDIVQPSSPFSPNPCREQRYRQRFVGRARKLILFPPVVGRARPRSGILRLCAYHVDTLKFKGGRGSTYEEPTYWLFVGGVC